MFQVRTKLIRIGCVEPRAGSSQKSSGTSAGGASHHRKERDCQQHRRKKRAERDSDHDALAAAAKITRLSLCHVHTALHERFGVPAEVRTRCIPLRR